MRILVEAIKSKGRIKLILYPDEEASGVIEKVDFFKTGKTKDGKIVIDLTDDARMYGFLLFLFLELRKKTNNPASNWIRFYEITSDAITEGSD